MTLETDFNVSPYFDDFYSDDSYVGAIDKNYHRVLFRPGYAVQARELTQIQTILQNQVERFANKVVEDGKIISGVSPKVKPISYAKLSDKDADGRVMLIDDFFSNDKIINYKIVGEESGVIATLIDAIEGSEAAAPDYMTIYFSYENTGTNGNQKVFYDDETLYFYTAIPTIGDIDLTDIPTSILEPGTLDTATVQLKAKTIGDSDSRSSEVATGKGLQALVNDGIIYHKGHFINVEQQGIIFEKYSITATNNLGFETKETIVNSNADDKLLDRATGATNYSAPGANRLKLTPTLAKRLPTDTDTTTFFAVAYIEEGNIIRSVNRELAGIDVSIADRVSEINGNFTVKPIRTRIREHKKTDNNLGRYTAANGGDANKLVIELDKTVAYVSGNRIEIQNKIYRPLNKATDKETILNRAIGIGLGNYVICDEVCGVWDLKNLDKVDLYDTAQAAITDGNYSAHAVSGEAIGSARVRGIEYYSGNPGTSTGKFKIYLFKIKMNSEYSFKDNVKGLYVPNSGGSGTHSFADIVLESNKAIIKETDLNTLVYPFAQKGVALYQDSGEGETSDAISSAQYVYRTETGVTITTTSNQIDVSLGDTHTGGNNQLNDGGGISESDETKYIIVAKENATTVALTGTIGVSGTTVTGSGTAFDTEYKEGDFITYSSYTARIDTITNATSMTLTTSAGDASSGTAHAKVYKKGHIFDFTADGFNLQQNGDNLQLTFPVAFAASFSAAIYANILRTSAVKALKVVNKNKFVQMNTSTHTAGANGPWSLGVPDAFKLVKVYKGTAGSTTTSDTDVTSHFKLDSGQKDNYYGYAKLVKKADSTLDTSSCGLLVEFHYFTRNTTSGVGFLTADSYPILDDGTNASTHILSQEIPVFTSPFTGARYDLRDSIDFRPILEPDSGSTPVASGGTYPVNPADEDEDTNFSIDVASFIPAVDENFQCTTEYFLPRKDKLVITKTGEVEIIEGVSSKIPKAPFDNAGAMTLATINIPPYPSLSPYVGRLYNRDDYTTKVEVANNRRYTMKDIRAIDTRVKNLEYYTSLNSLETSATNKQLFNDDGLDRFKNGIFVDSFVGHNYADPTQEGYRSSIDINRSQLRPLFEEADIPLQYNANFSTGSTNVTLDEGTSGKMILLNHPTERTLIKQEFASKQRNPVQEILVEYNGRIELNPPVDNTPNIKQQPEVQFDFDGIYSSMMSLAELAGIQEGIEFGNFNTVSSTNQWTTGNQLSQFGLENQNGGDFLVSSTTQQQVNVTTEISPQVDTLELGNLITNVAVSNYMRSRLVYFTATGMKPDTVVYPSFGDESVDAFCTPTDSSYANTAVEGSELKTDEFGNCYGVFRIPDEDDLKFTVGTHKFVLQDIENPETERDLRTTFAFGDYTSINLDVDQTETSIGITSPQFARWSNTVTQTTTTAQQVWFDGDGGDPLAQSFVVDVGDKSDGVFVSSLDLFFSKKSETAGVEVLLRDMYNGSPTTTVLGRKSLLSSEVNVDADSDEQAGTETTFTFDYPIFLENKREYCFAVKPHGDNQEYALWTADIGGTDVDTGKLIYSPPASGVMMTSANDRSWDYHQKEDVKFNINVAEFTTDPATFHIEHEDLEFLTIENITGAFNPGEKVTSSSGARGFVHFYNPAKSRIYLTNSNATSSVKFAATNTLTGSVSGATCTVTSVDDIKMNISVPKIPNVTYRGTSISFESKTTDSTGIGSADDYLPIDLGTENYYRDSEKIIYSKSNSFSLTSQESSTKSFVIKGTMSTSDKNVSPIIDSQRLLNIAIHNIINAPTPGSETIVDFEEWKNVGSAEHRYMSKPITLSDGNDAEDLKVFVTGYKPATTDIHVYARIHNPEDSEPLNDKDWTPLTLITPSTVKSDTANPNDFKEFEFGFSANTDASFLGATIAGTANGHARLNTSDPVEAVWYQANDLSTHTTFKTFAIKIVMTAEGSEIVPVCRDVRAIALQR